jgi:hypothetical protein
VFFIGGSDKPCAEIKRQMQFLTGEYQMNHKTRVAVKRTTTQVVDGIRYVGEISIAETEFDYELVFGVPIPKLNDLAPETFENGGVRKIFQITVKKGGKNVDLTDDEYGFFFSLIVEFVVVFYNQPQTRGNNEGAMASFLSGRDPINAIGAPVSIGAMSNSSYDFPANLCEALSAPKFGCPLAAF